MELPKRFAAVFAGAALSLVASGTRAAAQVTPPIESPETQSPHLTTRSAQEREESYQNLHRIVLDVQVFDPSGKPEATLKQTDFTVLRDDRPVQIAEFRAVQGNSATNPAEIIIVLDAVNNSSGKVAHFRKEIEKYLRQGNDILAHPMSIAVLSDSGVRIGVSSRDRTALIEELNELAGNLHSITCADTTRDLECNVPIGPGAPPCDPNPRLECLNHQFNASVPALTSLVEKQMNTHRRNILVWIGQGWPLLDDNRFIPDAPEVKESFFHNLVEVSSAMGEAQVTLDSISSSEILPVSPRRISESVFVRGIPDASHAGAASMALQALAYQSGGLVLASNKDIAGQISRCVAESESYYVLTFDSPPAARYGEYHSIAAKVDQPSRTVRTRTLYYGEQ
jgi:VWFA-related protein